MTQTGDFFLLDPDGEAAPPMQPGGGEGLPQALFLSKHLQDMLAETEAEFEQLPFFVRPMARRGFKGKAGQSLQEWQRTADQLVERLSKLTQGDAAAGAALRSGYPNLKEMLNDLIVYYEGVPGETARFTNDAEMLRQVSERTAERVASIQSLIAALEGML